MRSQNLIPEELQSFDYYKNKLPLYLQNSYGFQEHFRIWFDLLVGTSQNDGLIGNSYILLNLLNIFDPTYLEYISQLEDADVDENNVYGTKSDILDKLGALFGVTRNFTVTYTDDTTVTEDISLNNEDFLVLIKTQIIRNYCEGTSKQINEYYKSIKLQLYAKTLSAGRAILYLVVSDGDKQYSYSENIKKMFLAGMLKIDSMGILYSYSTLDLENLLIWDGLTTWAISDDEGGQWAV